MPRCFKNADKFGLKVTICIGLLCISVCIGLIFFFKSEEPVKSQCIIDDKINTIYKCHGVYGYHHYTDCGPTISYTVSYYLTETKSMISKWACSTQKPGCDCCFKNKCTEIHANEKKINECYPLIVKSLTKYHNIINGSMIDCWLDRSDNYFMEDQIYDSTIIYVILTLILVILCTWVCVCVYVLYKRHGYDQSINASILNRIDVEMEYGVR